jgi:hypothetical protein
MASIIVFLPFAVAILGALQSPLSPIDDLDGAAAASGAVGSPEPRTGRGTADQDEAVTEHASFILPPWDGQPRAAGEVWTLRKGGRVAVCEMFTHPYGGEARLTVDGEWHRGEAGRNGLALVELALEWKAQFQVKGWS